MYSLPMSFSTSARWRIFCSHNLQHSLSPRCRAEADDGRPWIRQMRTMPWRWCWMKVSTRRMPLLLFCGAIPTHIDRSLYCLPRGDAVSVGVIHRMALKELMGSATAQLAGIRGKPPLSKTRSPWHWTCRWHTLQAHMWLPLCSLLRTGFLQPALDQRWSMSAPQQHQAKAWELEWPTPQTNLN